MAVQIQLRRGTAAEWTSANPVLALAELGIETDTDQFKVGDGSTQWNALPYGGIEGPQGIQGIQGIQGVQGPQGDPTTVNGKTGASITLDATDVGADASGAAASAVSAHNSATTNVHGITNTANLATTAYVDEVAQGLIARPSVLGATSTNITGTYNNGVDGVGATITHDSNGVFPSTAGGATGWKVGSGILVRSQTNKEENGRYFISDMGSVSTPYVLTRCGYCDTADEIPGSYIFVTSGTFAGTGWVLVVDDPETFVVGTDDINVFQFSGAGTYTAGYGLDLTGTEFSVEDDGHNHVISNVDGLSDDLADKISKTIVDAKGDLIAATADNTVARVPVGSNGQVLTAASGQTAGVEWTTPVSTPLSSSAPANIGTAAVGSATDAARGDHVHAVVSPTAAGSTGARLITMSTSAPSGGADGDVWLVYT
jgi:hypothetical protein